MPCITVYSLANGNERSRRANHHNHRSDKRTHLVIKFSRERMLAEY